MFVCPLCCEKLPLKLLSAVIIFFYLDVRSSFSFIHLFNSLNLLHNHSKVAVGIFCKWASKLTLAAAWDSLGSSSAAAVCFGLCFIPFVVSLSLSPVWTQRVELHTHVRRAVYLISIYIRTKTYQSTLRKLKSKNHNIILIWWNLLSQNLVNPINSFNVLAKSLNSLKEKQMDDCKHKAALCPSWRRIKIERLDRTSQITFHPNRLKHDRSFYQSRMSRQRKGTSFPQFPSLLIRPTTLHFNGLCRKSMWDRLHRGRKRVWSSTNKHYGQTAAAPKVEISANRLALTLFWANATLLRAVIQKAANVAFLELLCFFVQLYLFCFRYKQLQHFFQQTLTYLSLIFLVH